MISYLCRVAVATGMRFGELTALRWDDINLLGDEIVVARTYTPGVGEKPTKSGEPRTIDLTPQARRLLEEWYPQTSGQGTSSSNAKWAATSMAGKSRRLSTPR